MRIGTQDDPFNLTALQGDEATYFSQGYNLMRLKTNIFWDSREEDTRIGSGSGVRIDLLGRLGQGLGDRSDTVQFIRYGVELSGFLAVYRKRTIGLRLYTELADPIGEDAHIPFAELITMGGLEQMRGFLFARFHGRSAFLASIDYRYPIWTYLDAELFYEVGNTFGKHLDGLELDLLRSSMGVALRSLYSRYVSFDLLFGIGMTPFDSPNHEIDSFRVTLGTNTGF